PLVKGPRDGKRLIEVGSARQMFGRAGRPQYDTEGHVFALAHEDGVKLAKWRVKYDSIPEDTKDPKLMVAKKALLKKKPTRRQGFTYWNPEQFEKLQTAPPIRLASRGKLSWRWLAYLLEANPAVEPIRTVIRQRLMDQPNIEAELKRLTRMPVTLSQDGAVTLDPPAPPAWQNAVKPGGEADGEKGRQEEGETEAAAEEESREEETTAPAFGELVGRLTIGEHVGAAAPVSRPSDKPAAP